MLCLLIFIEPIETILDNFYCYVIVHYVTYLRICFRMTLNRHGQFSYKHQADTSWDVSEWLLETRNHLTTWSDVYWYIWSIVNYLRCSRCHETFPCTEISNCRYHPERAVFEPNHLTGEHPCCGLRVQRFDPLQPNKVC